MSAAFLKNKREFLSIWEIAHAWEGLDPANADSTNPTEGIRHWANKIILGYFRKELTLRKQSGYRVLPEDLFLLVFNLNRYRKRLGDCIFKGTFDKELLQNTYVMRSEILAWCAKEFIEPPAVWALPHQQSSPAAAEIEDEDKDGWYAQLTDRRKKIVAGLEIAKHLWQQDKTRSYEDVFDHSLMNHTGFRSVFSFESFKKWARPFAPEEAKRGGRRSQSGN